MDVAMDAHQLKRIATNINAENAIEVCIASMHIRESLVNSLQRPAAMVDTLLKDWKQYMNSGGVLQRRSTPCWLTIVLSEVPVTPYCVRNDLSFVQRWCIQLINDKCNCLT